jgi:hypothetical protein
MVMNLVDLKECIKLAVMDPLDHRNLVSLVAMTIGYYLDIYELFYLGFGCRILSKESKVKIDKSCFLHHHY